MVLSSPTEHIFTFSQHNSLVVWEAKADYITKGILDTHPTEITVVAYQGV